MTVEPKHGMGRYPVGQRVIILLLALAFVRGLIYTAVIPPPFRLHTPMCVQGLSFDGFPSESSHDYPAPLRPRLRPVFEYRIVQATPSKRPESPSP